jgi:hypothetical protein
MWLTTYDCGGISCPTLARSVAKLKPWTDGMRVGVAYAAGSRASRSPLFVPEATTCVSSDGCSPL